MTKAQLCQHFACDALIEFHFSEPFFALSVIEDLRHRSEGEIPMYQLMGSACEQGRLFGQHFTTRVKRADLQHGRCRLTVIGDVKIVCQPSASTSDSITLMGGRLRLDFEGTLCAESDSIL